MASASSKPSSRAGLVLFILIIALAWGLMYSSYKVGLERAGPLWLASLRFEAFAVAALLAVLVMRGRPGLPTRAADWAAMGAYAGLNVVLHNLGTIGGAGHVPVAVIGVLAGTTPILTAGFARLVPPCHRLNRVTIIGFVLGFCGVAVLAMQGSPSTGFDVSPWALVVLAGFASWALGSVLIKSSGSQLDGLSLGLWGSLIGVAFLQPLAIILEPVPRFDMVLVAVAAFAGVVGGVVAFLLWLNLVRRYGARQANLVSFVSPVATTAAGAVFLGEPVQPAAFVAYAFISAGLAFAVRGLAQETAAAPRLASSAPDG